MSTLAPYPSRPYTTFFVSIFKLTLLGECLTAAYKLVPSSEHSPVHSFSNTFLESSDLYTKDLFFRYQCISLHHWNPHLSSKLSDDSGWEATARAVRWFVQFFGSVVHQGDFSSVAQWYSRVLFPVADHCRYLLGSLLALRSNKDQWRSLCSLLLAYSLHFSPSSYYISDHCPVLYLSLLDTEISLLSRKGSRSKTADSDAL